MLCKLLTRWSTLVLKVGVSYGWQSVYMETGSLCCGNNFSLKQHFTAVTTCYYHLKTIFKCICDHDESSRDLIKTQVD